MPAQQHLDVARLQAARRSRRAPARVTLGSTPRSMSLAPSSRITASVPSGTDQSSRASPPEAVSPETPALTISTAMPLGLQRLFELHRERRAGRKLIARRQRIAERHDLDGPLGRAGRARHPGERERRDSAMPPQAAGPNGPASHMSGARDSGRTAASGLMNDISTAATSPPAPAIALVRRQSFARPRRGPGPYPQGHRPQYRARRGDWPGRPVGLRQNRRC